MTSDSVVPPPDKQYLSIRTTAYGGRGYFASQNIPANTIILICNDPSTYVIFKPFKKEVCASCFSYENGKARKVKLNSKSNSNKNRPAYAGVYFCSEICRNNWSQVYDYDGLLSTTLEKIELAYNQSLTSKHSSTTSLDTDHEQYDHSNLNSIWEQVERDCSMQKPKKLLVEPLDGVEYDTARMVAIILVQKYRILNNSATTSVSQEWDNFTKLQSNELSHINQYPEFLPLYINVYKFLRIVLDEKDLRPLCTPQLLRDTIGREAGNAFGIWELPMMRESECFGTAVYPAASFFNHECEPSVQKKRLDHSMIFTTARDILKDEQLFISYGMMESLPYIERKPILTEQWHFECQCPSCLKGKLDSLSSTL